MSTSIEHALLTFLVYIAVAFGVVVALVES